MIKLEIGIGRDIKKITKSGSRKSENWNFSDEFQYKSREELKIIRKILKKQMRYDLKFRINGISVHLGPLFVIDQRMSGTYRYSLSLKFITDVALYNKTYRRRNSKMRS